MKKTPAILALALLTAAAGCSTQHGDYSTPPSDGPSTSDGSTGGTPGSTGDPTGSGGSPGTTPVVRTSPPADGSTAWAPDPADASFVNVQSMGATGDGVTDDTAAFRAAAATGKAIFVPKPPVAYVLTRFVPLLGSIYGDGSMPLVKMVGADGDPDQGHTRNMLYVSGYRGDSLVIQGLHLDGGWTGGTMGEWGHAVNVGNSSNVTIRANTIERAYGDGVFVGEFGGAPSQNVTIEENVLLDVRRCQVATDSVDGLVIRNNRIVKTGSYVSAIDLEPDGLGFQYVRRVTIDGNTFSVGFLAWSAGAISMNNPTANASAPASGDVAITNNRGTWPTVGGYMDIIPGSGALVGVVPHLTWYGLSAANNVRN